VRQDAAETPEGGAINAIATRPPAGSNSWNRESSSGQRVVGGRQLLGREAFDQFDDFGPMPWRKSDEGLQEPQAFDRFARWNSELLMQLCNECGIFYLAPLTGDRNGIFWANMRAWPKGRYCSHRG